MIFADGKTGYFDKNSCFSEAGNHLARLVIKGKKRKLQYFGVSDVSQPVPLGGALIEYGPNDQVVFSDVPTVVAPSSVNTPSMNTTSTNTTSTNSSTDTSITENGQTT